MWPIYCSLFAGRVEFRDLMAFNVDTPFSVMADWSWNEVCKYAREAAVFLDDYAAESLHWHGGCVLLYRAGAKSVKELSSFEVRPFSMRFTHNILIVPFYFTCVEWQPKRP